MNVEKLNDFFITIYDEYIKMTVYWLRPVSAENESLLTSKIKHRFFEMQYVLSGKITMTAADREIVIDSGKFMLIPPATYHQITAFEENTLKLVFAFDVEVLDNSHITDILQRDLTYNIMTESLQMRSLAELLITTGSSGSEYANIQIRCMTEAMFYEIITILSTSFETSPIYYRGIKACSKQELAKKLTEFISSSADKGFVTVNELADSFYISRRQLGRICMQVTGKQPHQLIDDEKLKYIRKMLSTTNHTLSEIAFLSGFSSEYAFVRFFKSKEGYTPGKYRQYSTM